MEEEEEVEADADIALEAAIGGSGIELEGAAVDPAVLDFSVCCRRDALT